MIRKALLWLVLLAFPLHGFAAGAMSHRPDTAMAVSIGHAHCAGAASAHAQPDGASMICACGLSQEPRAKCSLSAACSLVAAPALALPQALTAEPGPAPALPRELGNFAFCTGAPERPPRTLT
jgi:hypothetical protein